MGRADQVAAEPGTDDLLASIRRAIHDEGMDLPSVELEEGDQGRVKLMVPGALGHGRNQPAASRDTLERNLDRRAVQSNEIVALREKIAREINREDPTLTAPPGPSIRLVSTSRTPVESKSQTFADLLGGDENEALGAEPPSSRKSEELETARPAVKGRPTILPAMPRRSEPVYPTRVGSDSAGRGTSGARATFAPGKPPAKAYRPSSGAPSEGMISPEASTVAANAFRHLAEQMFGSEGGGRSIDDIARELLRPMLKQWLDQNLPRLVEQLVREEIERVARRGR
jgi:cell pole-organizing protein PopZ